MAVYRENGKSWRDKKKTHHTHTQTCVNEHIRYIYLRYMYIDARVCVRVCPRRKTERQREKYIYTHILRLSK